MKKSFAMPSSPELSRSKIRLFFSHIWPRVNQDRIANKDRLFSSCTLETVLSSTINSMLSIIPRTKTSKSIHSPKSDHSVNKYLYGSPFSYSLAILDFWPLEPDMRWCTSQRPLYDTQETTMALPDLQMRIWFFLKRQNCNVFTIDSVTSA